VGVLNDNSQKTPLALSLQKLGAAKAQDAVHALGKGLPCSVVAVISPGIVTVKFEVATSPATLPHVTMPVMKPSYIQYPIQIGDKGMALSADVRLGAMSGLGSGTPSITDTVGNLAAMSFVWLGNVNEVFLNPAGVALIEPTGNCNFQVTPSGAFVMGASGNLTIAGNCSVGNGASGSFVTADGLTVTVQDGIITNIY
jgi:hypothetical protein